ncbi:MAG TPA: toxin, partial [Bacteroidales bacterium]|nr:toxin [Bacteroidales bacterium]
MNTNPKSPNQPYTGQFYKEQQQTGGKTEAVTAGKGAAPSQADQPAQGTKNTLSPEKILTLPKGGGAIKGIGEKFQANPLTGTGSVSVPLPLSPGRGDFTPQLALSYDSGSGNSAFGLGFSVGLPSISRKTDKGLPLYHDLEESDVFVMSGAEDLVRLLDASGQKIAPEVRNAQGESYRVYGYRPRTEGLFARIERWENTSTGISHWRAVTRDNITTVYGMSSNARIAHPGDPVKVFQWMIERTADNRGNLIEYVYKPEDASNIAPSVFEDRRIADGEAFNQRYLKKVCYGNYTPSTVVDAPYTGGWHFELIFDYGEHSGNTPFYDEQADWGCRTDPFSTFRPGFEVRTYRLCHNILMFHRFTALGTSPSLVKMLALDHEQRPELTLLRSITLTGFEDSDTESFPPLSFSYTEPLPATECRQLTAGDIENFAGGDTFRWTDLYGEGLSGVLMQGGEAWYYKPNLGDKRYYDTMSGEEPGLWLGALNKVASFPNLSKGTAQLGDIDGNGRTDLRVMGPGIAGFTELSGDGKWESFRPFRHIPNIDMNDPNLKMIDLTGDGHADILITEHQCFTAHYSEAADGFGEAHKTTKPTDEIQGPAIVFADLQQSIYLADMSGDGLTDIVRVRNGAIDYWPNLGYGRFGKRVSMKGAPRFDATDKFEQERIRLADIDGTGTTDIIYLGTKAIRYWKNMAGNSWSTACEITHFPSFSKLDEVSIMDLQGNGTSCLTAMTPARDGQSARLQYLELTGGQKPFLMYEMNNNMGAVTTLTYAPSTKFYLADRMAGRPWITKLPFPVHVVERTEVHDLPTDTRYATRYAYHHGYFDGVEREFRGFGMVEQWDTDTLHDLTLQGEADQPPVYSKTWFHTGALLESGDITRQYASEYFNDPQGWLLPDTTLPEGLTATEAREACRALRGSILHQEVYAADGSEMENIPYTTAEKSYAVRLLQPRGTNPHAVFHVTEYDALAYNYERDANNPRVTRQMTLETDAYGNITRSATISYPSRQANPSVVEQSRMLVKYDEISYINEPDNTLFYRLGVPCEQKSYELHNIGQNSLFSHEFLLSAISTATSIDTCAEPGTTAAKRLIGHQQHYFYNTACNGRLPLAQVAAHGLPYHSLTLAWTDECLNRFVAFNTEQGTANTLLPAVSGLKSILAGAGYEVASAGSSYMIRSERLRPLPSSFHQPVEYFDPMENGSLITWDSYKILPVT